MTVPTSPAVSEAMREAVAREIMPHVWEWRDYLVDCGARGEGASRYQQCYSIAFMAGCRTSSDFDRYCRGMWPGFEYQSIHAATLNTSLRTADRICSGPIASEIARLTGDLTEAEARTDGYRADRELLIDRIAELRSDVARLTGEREAAREAVALCNNSFGSYSYHLNPHPAEQIEKIKAQARSEWQRAEAAEILRARRERDRKALASSPEVTRQGEP